MRDGDHASSGGKRKSGKAGTGNGVRCGRMRPPVRLVAMAAALAVAHGMRSYHCLSPLRSVLPC